METVPPSHRASKESGRLSLEDEQLKKETPSVFTDEQQSNLNIQMILASALETSRQHRSKNNDTLISAINHDVLAYFQDE